jgi:hypothetical protein
LKPGVANSLQDPILKKTHHKKRAGGVAQGVGPEFKAQYHKEKKKDIEQFHHSKIFPCFSLCLS